MRIENWPERLNDFLSKPHKFNWATCNCALFAFSAAEEITGKDFVAHYKGPKTKKAIIAKMRRICGGGVEDVMNKEIGDPLPSVLSAKRGDIISFDFGIGGPALGVCNGSSGIFISENDGLISVPISECRFAWSIN